MFFKDRHVLVTGAAGFVGTYFVEELLRRGARVRATVHHRPLGVAHENLEEVNADLTLQDDCRRVCRGVDCVVHAAGAVSAAGVTAGDNALNAIAVNLTLSAQMLQAAWTEKVNRFLLFSSSTGYPAFDHPVREEEFWLGDPHPSYFGYGWMRRYLERLGEFVQQRSSTQVAIVRPTAIYGERDDFDSRSSHVIPALIRRAVARENPYVVWGSGEVVRDFIHAHDLIVGSLLVLERHAICDPINIGSGSGVTLSQIVTAILSAAGHRNAHIQYDQSKPTTIPFRMADITKAKQLLGYEPTISLAEGIARTVEWYRVRSTQN